MKSGLLLFALGFAALNSGSANPLNVFSAIRTPSLLLLLPPPLLNGSLSLGKNQALALQHVQDVPHA